MSTPIVGPIRLHIKGMSCAACSGRVQAALQAQPGIRGVDVNLMTEVATIDMQSADDLHDAIHAVEAAGFEVETQALTLNISGMTCAACSSRVQQALKAQPGVVDAQVNLASETARIRIARGAANINNLTAAVHAAGFQANSQSSAEDQADHQTDVADTLKLRMLIAVLLATPVFALAMGAHAVPTFGAWINNTLGTQLNNYIQFTLTTACMLGPGLPFYTKGFPLLWKRTPDMNSLVAMGTSAAWLLSTTATFYPDRLSNGANAVYFEASAVIIALILLGRFMEARAKGKTGEAISQLLRLQAKNATVVLASGETIERPIADIQLGDTLLLKPGECVATDGVVLSGGSWVDESMISGEPLPVEKHVDDLLIGGTINGNGSMKYEATRVGNDTLLAQIISLVQDAQGARLPIQNMVDKVVRWFVPAVIAIAVAAATVWALIGPEPIVENALLAAVTVLIIACPCAMGLATPTSIMVGTGRAASMGILFRRGDALQSLQQVTTVAFDKTGTLTQGRPDLVEFQSTVMANDDILRLVASAEAQSEHPIAVALLAAAHKRGLELAAVSEFEALPGIGLKATVEGQQLFIGASRLMKQECIDISVFSDTVKHWEKLGYSPLYAAVDGEPEAIFAIADPLKPTSLAAIKALKAQGLQIAMISGDNRSTCEAIAAQLGIDQIAAEVLPEAKVDALRSLRFANSTLAFVGDGINDAPALATADIGIALGTGTDVAIESADVVLISGDLTNVVNAFEISQRTIRNIRQNLFWAFAYNVMLIPVAAGVLYPVNNTLMSPVLAAAAMALSSVFVVTNALRLRRVKPLIAHTTP